MNNIFLILQREFLQRVRKRNFIIITLLTPLLFAALIILPTAIISMDSGKVKKVVVLDKTGNIASNLRSSELIEYIPLNTSLAEARTDVKYNDVLGFLEINQDTSIIPQLTLHINTASTFETELLIKQDVSNAIENEKLKSLHLDSINNVIQSLKTPISLKTLDMNKVDEHGNQKESSSFVSFGIAYLFGFMIYMFIFLYGNMVMQGVIEEKSNRIIEVMVSSVKPFHLMLGKILGIAMVAIVQFLIWIAATILVVTIYSSFANVSISEMEQLSTVLSSVSSDITYIIQMLVYFVLFFIGGYLLYAAMFAAVGSAVENTADVQQLQLPITIPLILAIMIMLSATRDPNGDIAFWFSMIPFTSPIVMMARIPYGIPTWEILLSIVLLYATFIAMTMFAAKIYRVGIFMYGKKPTLKEIIKWFNYKI